MKILVTGSEGMLGRDLMAVLSKDPDVMGTNRTGMDVTDFKKIQDIVSRYKPVVVIHAAAQTNVDGCEADPWGALRVNAMGTQNVALACREVGAAMLYISTDYVFSGQKGAPYAEWDTPDPLSTYGQSKYAGEVAVRESLQKFYIVRTSGLYGRHGNSFIMSSLKAAQEKAQIPVVADQVTLPTYTRDLAEAIGFLVKTSYYGTYHITNTADNAGEGISWHDWAQTILSGVGSTARTVPITTAELGRPAYRPPYSVLGNTFYYLRGLPPLRPAREALRAFFSEVGLAGG
jgi:dTDP-4-dehydrorhamnose reductase